MRACRCCMRGVHHLVEGAFRPRLISLADLLEHVSDLVSPAALDRNAMEYVRQRCQKPFAAIHTDHFEALTGKPRDDKDLPGIFPIRPRFRWRPDGSR